MNHKFLITGASRGIGRAIALTLAKEYPGAQLACCYHNATPQAQSLQAEIQALGGQCNLYPGDLGDCATAQAIMSQALADCGVFQGIVLNAAMSQFGLCQDTSPLQWQQMINVNLNSLHSLLQVALPPMIQQQQGSIVTLSSMWGQVGASYEVAYSASKAGVIGLSKALAQELAPSGIRVNSVAPGLIQTDMNDTFTKEELQCFTEKIPLGRPGRPEEVAEVVCFLLSHKSSFLTGQVLGVNGGQIL